MKRKLHNFNTMDFLFFLIAIYPLVFPLFIMLITAISTESASQITQVNFDTWNTYFENFYDVNFLSNILGLENFNNWFLLNVVGNNESFFLSRLIECAEWYLVVYLLRMAFDFLMILPNIVHNFVHKIGGSSSD